MTNTAKTNNPESLQLAELVRSLLEQPFAQQQMLAQASWDQVSALLEGIQLPDGMPHEPALLESFAECKSTYCLILMELEARQMNPPADRPMPDWFPPANVPAKTKSIELSGATKDYWNIATLFADLSRGTPPFPREYAERLQGQNLCFALEAECQKLFSPALENFWEVRQAAIQSVVADTDTFALKKPLRNSLDEIAKIHADWLGDAKFPHTVVSLALRYVFARLGHQDYIPALSETGAFLLFFGGTGPIGAWESQNELQLSGISSSETIELCFRLFYTQRLRKRLLTVGQPVDAKFLQLVVANCKRALQLTHKIRLGKNSAEAAV